IPDIEPSTTTKLTIDGIDGFSFHQEVELEHRSRSISGLIQTDKPMYKPSDMVRFRVIVLDAELKPPANLTFIEVNIFNPEGKVVKKWNAAKLFIGVFEGDLQVPSTPMLGMWSISMTVGEEQIISKTFEVKGCLTSTITVRSPIDLQVVPLMTPLVKHQGLHLTIAAKYDCGNYLDGLAKVELYLNDDELDQMQEFEVHGLSQKWFSFNEKLDVPDNQRNMRVTVTFIEQDTSKDTGYKWFNIYSLEEIGTMITASFVLLTDRTVIKDTEITVYKYPYQVELVKDRLQFRPGLPFKCALQFRYHDGAPAKGISGNVEVGWLGYEKAVMSDDTGLVKLELPINGSIEQFHLDMIMYTNLPSSYNMKPTEPIDLEVTCNKRMSFFVYYVISKGKLIESSFVKIRIPSTKHRLTQIKASEKMFPKAKVVVVTVTKGDEFVWDSLDVDFSHLGNHFDIIVDENVFKLGHETVIKLKGRPGSYVGLAAYDKSLLDISKHHDIFWKSIEEIFNRFHPIHANDADLFHSTGLFVRTNSYTVLSLRGSSERSGYYINRPDIMKFPVQSNFLDTWLWKNVTIGLTGTHQLNETLPNTSASWCLTGFTIDPKYGMRIVQKPVQIKTILPFYIVENLPYSIKRGEVTVLNFTLFSNFKEGCIGSVTLYNVANEMELVGLPTTGDYSLQDECITCELVILTCLLSEESYTKSVVVPPNSGVSISFLVKVRKLGEITVRVKTSTEIGLKMEELEKVVRVVPENILFNKTISRIFTVEHAKPYFLNNTLDITRNLINNSLKVQFLLYLIDNVENLLHTPKAFAAPTMIDFFSNIAVIEYLKSIDSTDKYFNVIDEAEKRLMQKAVAMITTNYHEIMKYHNSDGSFGHWYNSKGSIFLTALIAKSLRLASKHISVVDANKIDKAFNWLASKQHSSGRFDEMGEITYQDLQDGSRNGVALTSYVMIAFLENSHSFKSDKVKSMIDKSVNYVAGLLPNITDVYDLSMATYAMLLHNHSNKAIALNKLIHVSTVNEGSGERYWPRESGTVETTAYGLLCYLQAKYYEDSITMVIWLKNNLKISSRFSNSHEIFVGLQAVARISSIFAPDRIDYVINLHYMKNRTLHFRITGQDENTLRYNEEMGLTIHGASEMISVYIVGNGIGMYQFVYECSVDIRNIAEGFILNVEKEFTNSNNTLNLKVCTSYDPDMAPNRSNKAIVEVNFPSGFAVNKIENVTITNPVQSFELLYNNTTMMVYYTSIGQEWSCFRVTANRSLKAAFNRVAYVLVHDVYKP
uniref:TEP1-F n=1 Tax=Anopheles dirus TaxID=7168 RepID=A0A182NGI1_9DIPT